MFQKERLVRKEDQLRDYNNLSNREQYKRKVRDKSKRNSRILGKKKTFKI